MTERMPTAVWHHDVLKRIDVSLAEMRERDRGLRFALKVVCSPAH
jgi:hypothetical protein